MSDKYPWSKNSLGYTKASRQGAYCRTRWLKLRAHILDKEPLCVDCKKEGKVTPATVVDHIKAIDGEDDPLFYDEHNLQSLCDKCHRKKTRKDNSRYSTSNIAKGKALMKELEG